MLNQGYVMNPDQEPIVERDKGHGMIRPARARRRQVITDVMAPNNRMEDVEPQSFDTNEEAQAIDDAGINEENQNTLAGPPVDFRQAMSGLSNYIRESGFQPHQRSGESAAINEKRKETAVQNYEQAQAIERRKQRQAVLSQGIMAIADLFTLNQKGGSGVTGAKPGVRISEEASNRLEAERITFERELEGYYNRLFQEAELEERVDQRNVEIANQIQRENLAGQVAALNEHISNIETGTINGFDPSRALPIINTLFGRGQDQQAVNLMQKWGLVDENFELDYDGIIGRTGEQEAQAQRDPEAEYEQRRASVRVDDYDRAASRAAALEREMEGMSAVERENDPRYPELQQARDQMRELQQDPAVERRIVERRYAQRTKERTTPILMSTHRDSPEFAQAFNQYVEALMIQNDMSEEQAVAAAAQFIDAQIRQEGQQVQASAEREVQAFVNEGSEEPTEEEIEAFLTQFFETHGIEDPELKNSWTEYIYNELGYNETSDDA